MTLSKISQPVLFVCTGNYYRSRIAEILFNHLAAKHALPLKGFSRGLRLNPQKNTGSISPHAMPFLSQIDISPAQIGEAAALGSEDLRLAGCGFEGTWHLHGSRVGIAFVQVPHDHEAGEDQKGGEHFLAR